MRTLLCLALVLMICSCRTVVSVLPGNFLVHQEILPTVVQEDDAFSLRGRHTLFVRPDEVGSLEATVVGVRLGKYTNKISCALYAPDGREVVSETMVPPGCESTLKAVALPDGIYRLEVNTGVNAARVSAKQRGFCLAATAEVPLHLVNQCPRLYFLTCADAEEVQLQIHGDFPNEHVNLTVFDADGKCVFEGTTVGCTGYRRQITVPIAPEQRGKIWSLQMGPVPGQGFEDMELYFCSGAEPVLALSPDQLLFPLFNVSSVIREEGRYFMGVHLSSLVQETDGICFKMAFQPSDGGATQNFLWKSGSREPALLGMEYRDKETLWGTIAVELLQHGRLLVKEAWPVTACEGISFWEVPWKEQGEKAVPTDGEKAVGVQVFQRNEPGFVRPAAYPHPEEITDVVSAETSGGLFSTEFFAFYPLRDFDAAQVTVGALKNADGVEIPAGAVEVLTANTWIQRTDWNSKTYIIAPELLERKESTELMAARPQLYAIRVAVPKDAAPGIYRAPICLNGVPCASYRLIVDDFELPEISGMTFGLYADGDRWTREHFTDEEILREMRDFRAHGINSLMLYPFPDAKVTYDGKDFQVDLGSFRHQMELYCQVGFEGMAVISFQDVNRVLKKALKVETAEHTPEFVAGFHAILDAVRKMGEEDHWPAYCIHTVDEPSAGNRADEAIKTIRLVKQAGFLTFNTCYGEFVRKHLAPWLDCRCYSNVAFESYMTKESTEELRAETLADGDQFWWYGSGCYTNGGLMQDCNIYSNRFMLGAFHWRSQATGAWTWTFLRIKGTRENDLDGNEQVEAKEACICYPDGNHGLIHTLQWEAIREGIYDCRYLALWKSLCDKAAADPAKAERARQSEKSIQGLLDKLPWTCMNYAVSNAQLRALRAALIQEIQRLKM